MTRLDQALRWWDKQNSEIIFVVDIPIRHFQVLKKHKKIKRNFAFGLRGSFRLVKRESI